MSDLLEKLAKEGSVPLERYGHQVGGHHMLFKFKETLCKPVIHREHFFYQTAPQVIRRYIPSYYGVVNVSYVHQASGAIKVVAYPRDQPVPVPPSVQPANSPSSELAKSWVRGNFPKCTTGATIHNNGTSITSSEKVSRESYKNPWAIMCSHNMDERLKELGGDLDSFTNDYMILENLTIKYRSPCVLDLKVGTRQHGDDAPLDKIRKHLYTCSISTSSSLGVRMAGMQKFNALKNEYIFYDKYFGKQLTREEFGQVLRAFLCNGICFRSDLLPVLVRMLEDLRASIGALPTYRYFSSSLLVLYDGAECPKDLGMVAGTTGAEEEFDSIVLRAKEAEEINEYRKKELNSTNQNGITDGVHGNSDVRNNEDIATPTSLSPTVGHSFMSEDELAQARRSVDIRMIDFAHATHSRYKDAISHQGLDEGYLTGLDSLIEIFKGMRTEYSESVNGHDL